MIINYSNKKIGNYKCFILLSVLLLFIILITIYGFAFIFNDNKSIKLKIKKIMELNKKNLLLNFNSYSQFYEDLILYSIFYDINNGFYIDIGANDPNYISVTKAFYMIGWNGINIEPLPDKFKQLAKIRKKDINLNIAVGASKGNASLYIKDTGSSIVNKYSGKSNHTMNILYRYYGKCV